MAIDVGGAVPRTVDDPGKPGDSGNSGAERFEIETRPTWEQVALYIFVILPFLALIAGLTLAVLGHGITWLDVILSVVFYAISGHGITVGFHRYFTHFAFKAKRPLRLGLAIAGSMAVEGPVIRWVADHRKHHKFSDRDGDPHSPWRFGTSTRALIKGMWWAHTGWLFDREQTPKDQYAPDLQNDATLRRVSDLFGVWVAIGLIAPPLISYGVTGSWHRAAMTFLWASLVRVFVLHHTTWSINSICHMWGEQPYKSRDKSTNFWPLAVLSMGESWHNLHHADPTCARHGVDRGQLDSSARMIALFEWFGWAYDVRWPRRDRLDAKRAKLGVQASAGAAYPADDLGRPAA